MLFLIATPIGNIQDFSFRAVKTLESVDAVLCEDTRHSLKLLSHYGIKKPLISFHKFSEAKKQEDILRQLKEGRHFALVSDSGTPLISDPGFELVKACREEGIEVTFIPGASAVTSALVLSGFSPERFQFIGFLPKKGGERKQVLEEIGSYSGTSICFESPNRVEKVLQEAVEILPSTRIALCREITKKFEEVLIGTAGELLEKTEGVKGEIVLVFEQSEEKRVDRPASIKEHVNLLIRAGLSEKEAMAQAAKERGVSKKEIYKELKVK